MVGKRNISKNHILRHEDIEKIFRTYRAYAVGEKYSNRATFDEIEENDFNFEHSPLSQTFK